MAFINKLQMLCEDRGEKLRAVTKKIGIGDSTVTNWLNGTIPKLEHIVKVADYFGVSLDYLAGNEEISIKPSSDIKTVFNTLKSTPQRYASLRRGNTVSNEEIVRIADYTDSPMLFLLTENKDFVPAGKTELERLISLFDFDALHLILDIMDKCADSEQFRILQVQLSRIVFYHLESVGITAARLREFKCLEGRKVDYITSGNDSYGSFRYGFNYSDLSSILGEFPQVPSYRFLFTGIGDNPIEILKTNSMLKKKILGE